MIRHSFILASLFLMLACDQPKLDQYGGYYDEELQIYRYRKITRNVKAVEGLVKPFPGKLQSTKAVVTRVDGGLIWVKVENRDVYTLITQDVSSNFKNEKEAWLGLWLEGVSLNSLPSADPKTNQRVRQQINEIITKVMLNQEVVINFELAGGGNALQGVLFLPGANGEDLRQSLNYWIIKQGLSPYILPPAYKEANPYYLQAEDIARENGRGIWS